MSVLRSGRHGHDPSPPILNRSQDHAAVGAVHVADVNLSYAIRGRIRAAACVNERIAWTAEEDGGLRVRSLPKGTVLKDVDARVGGGCCCLHYVALQHQIWAAFEDGAARVYDAASCALVHEFAVNPGSELGRGNKIHAMAELEGCVFIGCEDASIVQRNALDSRLERTLRGHKGAVRALATYIGPTGSVVFSGSNDGSVKGWDPYTNGNSVDGDAAGCIHTFRKGAPQPSSLVPRGAICALEVVPHTNRIWSGGDDHAVRVWNLETLDCDAVLQSVHAAPVTCLMALGPRLWSGDAQGRILLWDMASLTILQDLSSRERLDTGELWFIKKIQPAMSWKVWTAGAKGEVQCWNAETSPILLCDPHADADGDAGSTGEGGSGILCRTEPWALLVQNDSDNLPCEPADVAELGFSLACERGRLRLQHELQIHQLLEEENAFLKKRVQKLEAVNAEFFPPQETQRDQFSKSPTRTAEDDIVSILRHEREVVEKEVEFLRDENYTLLRLLEQHTERGEEAKYLQKSVSKTVVRHPMKSEPRQGDAPRGNAMLSASTSQSPSAQMRESSEHASASRNSSPGARQMSRGQGQHASTFAKPKKEPLHQPSESKSRNREDLRTRDEDNLSVLKNQCNKYQAHIKDLLEEKERLNRALANDKQRKMHDLKHKNNNTQGMTSHVSPARKDVSTRLEPGEVASLREELAKVRLICANKTAALLKLQKELDMLKRVGGGAHSRLDTASQSTTPLWDSHVDDSLEMPKTAPSPTPRSEHTAQSSGTRSNHVGKELKFLQPSLGEHRTTAPRGRENLSPEAQNLALSVRLTDAESVITELESLLNRCMNQLAEEREARHHLEQRISGLETTSV